MKQFRKLIAFLALGLALASANSTFADDKGKPEKPANNQDGKPPEGEPKDNSGKGNLRDRGLEIPRFGVPPKVELPEALQKLVDQYRKDSESFLAGQKDLLKQLKGATAEEKAKIKETLKGNREKFLADHKELITEIRQQIADIKKDLKNHDKPVDAGGDDKGGRRRGGQ
jgi:hypothetical protein